MLKRGLCLIMTAIMLFSLSGCSDFLGGAFFLFLAASGDDRTAKDTILEFVSENEEGLLTAIESGDFSAFENKGFIKDIDASETVVDFSCGGAGIGSATSYVGFYYTPTNDMAAAWCAPSSSSELIPSGNGYEWREPGGDNRYYTELICGNFYYYEASF